MPPKKRPASSKRPAAVSSLASKRPATARTQQEEAWPDDLAELVRKQSNGRLALAENAELGRHLVATEDLPAHEAVLTESALIAGSDLARSIQIAAHPEAAAGMVDAFSNSESGGSDPLAHMDLFFAYLRLKQHASGRKSKTAADASVRLERLSRWFCQAYGTDVDRAAQTEKLSMVTEAIPAKNKHIVSLAELRKLDDILARNAEEFTGSLCYSTAGHCLKRRRFQGLFPCKDLVQHSCHPNCYTVAGPTSSAGFAKSSFLDGEPPLVLQMITLRQISKGEQISWSYLPYWKQLLPTQLRRKALHEGWGFHCRCSRCSGSTPEVVMAYLCPAPDCGANELCPALPCAAKEDSLDKGHLEATQTVDSLVCLACGLTVLPGGQGESSPGDYEGYLERCMLAETNAFNLPWRCGLGKDLEALEPDCRSVLAKHHWVFADQHSYVVENAAAVLQQQGVLEDAGPGLLEALQDLAAAAGQTASALRRLVATQLTADPRKVQGITDARSVALPDLLTIQGILATSPEALAASAEEHRNSLGGWLGTTDTIAVAEELAKSKREFLEKALGAEALATACDRTRQWLQRSPDGAKDDEGSNSLWAWVLRWLWLKGGASELEEAEEEELEVDPPLTQRADNETEPPSKRARKCFAFALGDDQKIMYPKTAEG